MKTVFKTMGYFAVLVAVLLGMMAFLKPKIYKLGKASLSQSINKKFVLNSTHMNDNKDYTLEVYRQSNYSSSLGLSSSHGFAEAYVVLKDKQSEVLLEPHWYASCDFIIGDLQIEWQEKANRVYFTKFNYIDLTAMSFDCY